MPGIKNTNIYRTEISYNVNDQIEYFGIAPADALLSEARWRITKRIYNGPVVNGKPSITSIHFADGSIEFNKVWNYRNTYDYQED